MKIKINLSKRDYRMIVITLTAGLFFGWLFFHGSKTEATNLQTTEEQIDEKQTIWTCSMHPQVRMDHPGKCPICGMDLIPLQEYTGSEQASSPDEIRMTEAAMKIADIQTMVVKKAYPDKKIYLLGKVKPDERNIAGLTARFGGRIEKLYINFTGQHVKKGGKLATIYSPALVTAQKELLEALEYRQSNPGFYKAARNKLKLWDLTDEQIDNIEKKGEAQYYFDVLSPISGTVTIRYVAQGDYVKEGSALFQIVDLTRIWVMFEAYESDLPWIKPGDHIDFTLHSLVGKNFRGMVTFIDPVIDPETRIARVRVEVRNTEGKLKPEMFADGVLTSTIAGSKKDLLVPKTSVLWTGKRALVYVKVPGRQQPSFINREIVLGPEAGEYYVVNKGLKEGEEIAVNGVFRIDAAAQLAGKPSMMNPDGGKVSPGHDHATTETGGSGGDHSLHRDAEIVSSGENHSKHGDMEVKSGTMAVDTAFRYQLTGVYDIYLGMKDAFVASDPAAVAEQAGEVFRVLARVDMKLLDGDAHLQWMDQLETLIHSLEKIMNSNNIEIQRAAFAEFNLAFYKSIKTFGLPENTIYYQYCPMAFGNEGAYWLSGDPVIRNPYFGDEMLSCGENRDTLAY
jgi:Cu(I)/Ag(I) efflux system membrane fusion protein